MMPEDKMNDIAKLADNLIKKYSMQEDTAIKLAVICQDSNLVQLSGKNVDKNDWEDIFYTLMIISKKLYGDAVLYDDTQKGDNGLQDILTLFTENDIKILNEACAVLTSIRSSIFNEAERLNEENE